MCGAYVTFKVQFDVKNLFQPSAQLFPYQLHLAVNAVNAVQISVRSLRPSIRNIDSVTVAGVVRKRTVGLTFALAVRIFDVADCAAVVVEHRFELRKGGVVERGGNSVVTWQDERAVEGEDL